MQRIRRWQFGAKGCPMRVLLGLGLLSFSAGWRPAPQSEAGAAFESAVMADTILVDCSFFWELLLHCMKCYMPLILARFQNNSLE